MVQQKGRLISHTLQEAVALNKGLKVWFAAVLLSTLTIAAATTTYAATKLGTPGYNFWEGTKAAWEEVEDAHKYEVRLYKDERIVWGSRISTKRTSYSYKNRITQEGCYTFQVRVIGKNKNYTTSNWSEYSDEFYVSAAEAEAISAKKTARAANVNTGGSGPGDTGGSKPKADPGWKQDTNGWWYVNGDNTYPVNAWQMIDDKWYYFDEIGYMHVGWYTEEGKTFYLEPQSGALLTGIHVIDGENREFDITGVLIR